jgi:hypothetical protein
MRPNVSAAPPAAKGAMILTGRLGQSCAGAEAQAKPVSAAAVMSVARSLSMVMTVRFERDPEKLQAFRIGSCGRAKIRARNRESEAISLWPILNKLS